MTFRPAHLPHLVATACLLAVSVSAAPALAAAPRGHKSHTSTVAHPGMSPERATAIQAALIKNGYLSGEPTGKWDEASISAMQKLQGDNGWQTKIVPDSRALIKLGLGPQETASAAH